jgi:hypothetical protein
VVVSAEAWDRIRHLATAHAGTAETGVPLFNHLFALGLLGSAAWALLARRGGVVGAVGFIGLQILGVLTLSREIAFALVKAGFEPRTAAIAVTLVWAAAGALQWLRSLSTEAKGLRLGLAIAGYAWLGLASFKLIFIDLASSDLALKAVVFLGVGLIFLAAALVGSRVRNREDA